MNQTTLVDNTLIQQALQDGSFVQHVKSNLTNNIISIGFWGLEPSVNSKYFASFVQEILDYSSYIRYIIIPTNGTNTNFFNDFVVPINDFCFTRKRKIKLVILLSLDGPKSLQNSHCPNSYDLIMQSLQLFEIKRLTAIEKFFKIQLILKSTFTAQDLLYNKSNWDLFMQDEWFKIINIQIPNNDLALNLPFEFIDNLHPTLAVPGNYTKLDGINLCKWNIPFDTSKIYECAAGITSKTIDYQGNLYDCHMLCNKVKSIQDLRPDFENKMNQLVAAGEVIELDRDKLFNAISSIYCWATGNEEISESYIKLLGNGAIL